MGAKNSPNQIRSSKISGVFFVKKKRKYFIWLGTRVICNKDPMGVIQSPNLWRYLYELARSSTLSQHIPPLSYMLIKQTDFLRRIRMALRKIANTDTKIQENIESKKKSK